MGIFFSGNSDDTIGSSWMTEWKIVEMRLWERVKFCPSEVAISACQQKSERGQQKTNKAIQMRTDRVLKHFSDGALDVAAMTW